MKYISQHFCDKTMDLGGAIAMVLEQVFPTWGTCTPRGAFPYLKGYI